MKELLATDFLTHYKIMTPLDIETYIQTSDDGEFDVDDCKETKEAILPKGNGKLTIKNEHGLFSLLCYDKFIGDCKKPRSFQAGRKRCDYVLWHENREGTFLLCEITSAYGDERNLEISMKGYEGGKLQQAEDQLAESLKTLMEVPTIKAYINDYSLKTCVMAYKVIPCKEEDLNQFLRPFRRYSEIENKETKMAGAEFKSEEINAMGFTFRRILHDTQLGI